MQKRTMRDEKILILSSTFRLSIKQRLISNPLDSDFFRLPKNVVPVGSGWDPSEQQEGGEEGDAERGQGDADDGDDADDDGNWEFSTNNTMKI